MAEYIEREAAMTVPALPKEYRTYPTANLDDAYEAGWNDALNTIGKLPRANAKEIIYAHWIESKNFDIGFWVCSNCRFVSEAIAAPKLYDYCPHCGAEMSEVK